MNLNEVIAHRANELAGYSLDHESHIHPNDDVNRSQSTNDTFPTAMHLATALTLRDALHPALDGLLESLDRKSEAFADVVKIGRTHLQDATPLTLGQEIGGWAAQIRTARRALVACEPLVHELAAGGTAVGTGLNAPQGFGEAIAEVLAAKTDLPLVTAPNKFAALAGHEAMAAVSGALSTLAAALFKVANDVRFLASGPRCGLGELRIPANEPGSSIMPGKVNPTQSEALIMVCLQVFGNHTTVNLAASQGSFELNVCMPVIAHGVLQSIRLLADAASSFDVHCVAGLEADREILESMVQRSLMLVTALSPHIGYEAAAEIAKKAHADGSSLREAALSLGRISAADFDRWLRVEDMLGPRSSTDG
jgi:fumarate hydratase class II